MTPELPWTPNSQKYPIYTKFYLNFDQFCSTAGIFKGKDGWKLEKLVMHQMTSRLSDLENLTVKRTLHRVTTYPEAQILVLFAVQPALFEIQDCWKWEKLEVHQVTSEWLDTFNGKKPPIYN